MRLLLLFATASGWLGPPPTFRRGNTPLKSLYRVYDVGVSVGEDPGAGASPRAISDGLVAATRKRLPRLVNVTRVVRKSLDTRKHLPRWVYVVEAEVSGKVSTKQGRVERVEPEKKPKFSVKKHDKNVIVVGCGPAGLFCALELAEQGAKVVILERGEAVERRGADIGRLIHRKLLDPDSNFAYGEGGAGTWSDGKLTTRIGRNEADARRVLEVFVQHGAPDDILVSGAPHLGTDTLVRLLRSLRSAMMNDLGIDIEFRAAVEHFETQNGRCVGVLTRDGRKFHADAVVVAAGHSADDTYAALRDAGAKLVPKGLAVGFRIEHPQALVNKAAYGHLANRVRTGKKRTDQANQDFLSHDLVKEHLLPVPGYRLTSHNKASNRSTYSFCCCPGGQVVPASTSSDLVVVNGMSFSKRDSPFANAALVVTVSPDDPLLDPYRSDHGPLAALAFQRDAERRAATLGGGDFVAPVSRLTDFIKAKSSKKSTTIASSYRLGVKETDCRTCYPEALNEVLIEAVLDDFERSIPGFICDDAILHGVETRTSAPCQVERHRDSCESTTLPGLFPCGEGAGHAGGIISAAVDGIRVARALLQHS